MYVCVFIQIKSNINILFYYKAKTINKFLIFHINVIMYLSWYLYSYISIFNLKVYY